MRTLACLLLAACYHGGAEPSVGKHVPDVQFALASGATVRIVRLTDSGLVVERTVDTPAIVSRVFWVGDAPAVWLDRYGGMPDEPPHVHKNEVGTIGPRDYAKFAPVAWPAVPRPHDGSTEIDDHWLTATATELWEGRCSWYGGPDGGWCEAETFARRYPAPVAFVDKAPAEPKPYPLATAAVPASLGAQLVSVKAAKLRANPSYVESERTRDVPDDQRMILQCTYRGTTIDAPSPDEESDDNRSDIVWLSTEPPIFQITVHPFWAGVGRAPSSHDEVFEGCERSRRYTRAVAGPHELVVLLGDELSVRWHGREVGHLTTGGGEIAFH